MRRATGNASTVLGKLIITVNAPFLTNTALSQTNPTTKPACAPPTSWSEPCTNTKANASNAPRAAAATNAAATDARQPSTANSSSSPASASPRTSSSSACVSASSHTIW
jgi:hypothetical protein